MTQSFPVAEPYRPAPSRQKIKEEAHAAEVAIAAFSARALTPPVISRDCKNWYDDAFLRAGTGPNTVAGVWMLAR